YLGSRRRRPGSENYGPNISQPLSRQGCNLPLWGEEFSIILPEASAEDAAKRANVLRDEVRKLTIRYLDQNLDPVTLSIGLATFPQHGSTGEQLLRIADQCLYQSKAAGRDRVTTPHASEDVTKREASVIG